MAKDRAEEKKTILLVEDEAFLALGQKRFLERKGYDVIHVRKGEQAVELVNSEAHIDLVLMDIDLGEGMDGTETAKKILARERIPLIFLSSHTGEDIIEKTDGIDACSYVAKKSGDAVLLTSIQMAFRLFESQERELAQRSALEESEKWFRTLANSTATGIFIYQGKRFVYANEAISRITGYPLDEFLSLENLWEIAHPDHRELAMQRSRDRQAGKKLPTIYELKILRKDGETRWVEISGGVIDWRGEPAAIGTAFDITKRKMAHQRVEKLLQEKELILKETHHRVKNNMNVISGLLSLQAGELEGSECEKVLLDAAGRAQSMMVLYDKLYRAEETGWLTLDQFLKPLVEEIMQPFYSSCHVETSLEIEAIPMHAKSLSSLGIIINEMVTNSMKYAFRGRDRGEVSITAFRSGEVVTIRYRDDGIGLPEGTDFSEGKTFGMQLIQLLTEQLSGSLEVKSGGGVVGGGTELIITFPCPVEADRC